LFFFATEDVSVAFHLAIVLVTPEVPAVTDTDEGSSSDSVDIPEGEFRRVAYFTEETADSVPPLLQLQLRYLG